MLGKSVLRATGHLNICTSQFDGGIVLRGFWPLFFFPLKEEIRDNIFCDTERMTDTISHTTPPSPPPKKKSGRKKSQHYNQSENTFLRLLPKRRIKRYIITKGFSLDSRSDTMMNASLKGNIFVSFKSLATPTVLIHPCDKGSSESYFTIFIISQERENTCGSSPQSATHQVYKWQ